jgi:hypothetical protein
MFFALANNFNLNIIELFLKKKLKWQYNCVSQPQSQYEQKTKSLCQYKSYFIYTDSDGWREDSKSSIYQDKLIDQNTIKKKFISGQGEEIARKNYDTLLTTIQKYSSWKKKDRKVKTSCSS